MGFFSRILGTCRTKPPQDPECWRHLEGRLEVDLDRVPELKRQDGAVRLEGRGEPLRVLLIYGQDGRFHAFENKCSHGGRRLDPLPDAAQIQCCSLGRSTFDYRGERLSGAAKGPVRTLLVEQDGSRLIIHTT